MHHPARSGLALRARHFVTVIYGVFWSEDLRGEAKGNPFSPLPRPLAHPLGDVSCLAGLTLGLRYCFSLKAELTAFGNDVGKPDVVPILAIADLACFHGIRIDVQENLKVLPQLRDDSGEKTFSPDMT